jgi:hypothetical protein
VYDVVTHACILTPKISIPEMLLKSGTNALRLELPGESFWFTTPGLVGTFSCSEDWNSIFEVRKDSRYGNLSFLKA